MRLTAEEREALGRRRRAARALAGLTQQELAQRAGRSRQVVVRAEQGHDIEEASLRALASALGIGVGEYADFLMPAPVAQPA